MRVGGSESHDVVRMPPARAASTAARPATPGRASPVPLIGFVARFLAGWVVALALVAGVPAIEAWAVRHTVASLGGLAALLHIGFGATGTTLRLAGTTIEIVPDCTPLMPTAALWIAILAFPSPWPRRLAGLAAGAVGLWLYNLARILALVPVLRFRPRWFDFIHVYLWQTMTLLVVFAMFLLWLWIPGRPRRVERGERAAAAPPPSGSRP